MGKTDIILLASGNSRRYGNENKLLAPIDGKPMFTYAIDLAVEVKRQLGELVGELVIVSKYKEIEDYVRSLEEFSYQENVNSHRGISESIHIGVNATNDTHAALFFVCDQPKLKKETLCNFIRKFEESKKKAGAVTNSDGNLGNPCVFAPSMRPELMKITGDTGGKQILRKLSKEECFFMEAQTEELVDIDYRE